MLTKERLVEAIAGSWYSGKSQVMVPLTLEEKYKDPPNDTTFLSAMKSKKKYPQGPTYLEIKWTKVHSHMANKSFFVFHSYLNGWLFRETTVTVSNEITGSNISGLILNLTNSAASQIIESPQLAKFLQPKSIEKFSGITGALTQEQQAVLYASLNENGWVTETPEVDDPSFFTVSADLKDSYQKALEDAKKAHQSAYEKMVQKSYQDMQKAQEWSAKHIQELYETEKVYDTVKYKYEAKLEQYGYLPKGYTKNKISDTNIEKPPLQQKPKKQTHWQGSKVQDRAVTRFPALNIATKCPVDTCDNSSDLNHMIQHLNDHHMWKRTADEAGPGNPNIADWLDEWSVTTGNSLEIRNDQ